MSWVNRLFSVVPGFGNPFVNDVLYQSVGTALTTSNTVTLSGFAPTISKGFIRMKIYGAQTSPTVTKLQATLSDGTQFVTVYYNSPGTALTLDATGAGTTIATDGAMAIGSKNLTSAAAAFTPSMVGSNVSVPTAGNSGGTTTLFTTIASFLSAGTLVLATANVNASAVSGQTVKTTGSYFTGGSATAPAGFDVVFPFEVDMNATRLDVTETGAGIAFMDLEISGTV